MGTKIDDLPQVATTTGSDELPISQDNGSGGRITYKATLDQVKNYVRNTGGGTGSVTSVGVTSPDGSIGVFGSPIVGAGTITVNISSVKLDKINDGGATSGQVLTYNGSTSTWVASAAPKELPSTAINSQVLTYNGSTSTWVASAVPSLISNFTGANQSLAESGYQKLPGGLIIQWGIGVADASGILTVTWPIQFPNKCFVTQATTNGNSSGAIQTLKYMSKTTTGGSYSVAYVSGTTWYGSALSADWFAIGY